MAGLTKRARRSVRSALRSAGRAIVAAAPEGVRTRALPAVRYFDMLVFDHLLVRLAFPNRHRISPEAWRGAQPLPHHIADLGRRGVRTIVNLRGALPSSTYAYERAACERAGIRLVDFRVRSRDAPSKDELNGARALFESIEYPVLMHCKSGADRVGLMSALFRHVRLGVPIEEARRELSLRFGHIRQADTGVLDYFFERYLADTATRPMPFYDWIEQVYDPAELRASFRSNRLANKLVDKVLRRE